MSIKRRIEQLEKQNGSAQTPVIRVCWHGPDEKCDCPPADVTVAWETRAYLAAAVKAYRGQALTDEERAMLARRKAAAAAWGESHKTLAARLAGIARRQRGAE